MLVGVEELAVERAELPVGVVEDDPAATLPHLLVRLDHSRRIVLWYPLRFGPDAASRYRVQWPGVHVGRQVVPHVAGWVPHEFARLQVIEIIAALPWALVVVVEHLALVVHPDPARRADAAGGGDDGPVRFDAQTPAAKSDVAGERAG